MTKKEKNLEKINQILACPRCKGELTLKNDTYECTVCLDSYRIIDGIPIFVNLDDHPDAKQIMARDKFADGSLISDEKAILNIIKKNHYISLMRKQANNFLGRFNRNNLILDIGVGWGWHWLQKLTCTVICIDFSFKSLLIAKNLLKDNKNIFLICADASMLPFKHKCFDGIWSSQALPCLPPDLFNRALKEMDTVLTEDGYFETRWLNDNSLLRLAYLLSGRKYQKVRCTDFSYTRRLSKGDLIGLFKNNNNFKNLQVSYEELLFHPTLKFTHNSEFMLKIDRQLASIPFLNKLIANQSVISGKKGVFDSFRHPGKED